jgi:hypothetical protein
MKAKFYGGKLWKWELESLMVPMLESYDVVVVDDNENLIRCWLRSRWLLLSAIRTNPGK